MAQSPVLHIGRTSNLFKRRAEYTEEQEIRRSDGFYFSTRFLEQWYSAFGFCLHFFVSEKHVCWYMLCSGMCSLFYSSVTWNCGGAQSACDSSSQALHPSALYTHGIVRLPVPCSTILFFRVSSRDAILMSPFPYSQHFDEERNCERCQEIKCNLVLGVSQAALFFCLQIDCLLVLARRYVVTYTHFREERGMKRWSLSSSVWCLLEASRFRSLYHVGMDTDHLYHQLSIFARGPASKY
jgi:hypothetical protein